ncbi:MAG: SDR family NAD(P)-dependent oxidoreductase [Anaerolineaceae bacterium]|nr:SDR family NAD(P)-dependent oxidoreductase [Anaerolineaceae bacterium]
MVKDNQVVLLSGGNAGLGLGMVKGLLEAGRARVAVFDLSLTELEALRADDNERLIAIEIDITDPEQVQSGVEAVLARWGQIDVLVNNACLAIFQPFEEKAVEDTRREFEVNYFGMVNLIHAVLPVMKARGGGTIHNVSSGVGLTGFANLCGYTSTKGAIESLTHTLSIELAPYGITVNLIHPPLMRTASSADLGIPPEMLADPDVSGRRMARQLGSSRDMITADFQSRMGLFGMRHFPVFFGRMFSKLSARYRAEQEALKSSE